MQEKNQSPKSNIGPLRALEKFSIPFLLITLPVCAGIAFLEFSNRDIRQKITPGISYLVWDAARSNKDSTIERKNSSNKGGINPVSAYEVEQLKQTIEDIGADHETYSSFVIDYYWRKLFKND